MISEIQLSTSTTQGTPKDKASQTESGFQDLLSALTSSQQADNSFTSSWAQISGNVINSTLQQASANFTQNQNTAQNNNNVDQNAPIRTDPQQSSNTNSNSNAKNDPLVNAQYTTSKQSPVRNNSQANENPTANNPDQTSGNAPSSSQADQNQNVTQNSQTQNSPDQQTQTTQPQNDSLGNNKDIVQKLKDLGLSDQQIKDAVALLDKEAQAGSDKLLKMLTGMENPGISNIVQDLSQNIDARTQFLSLLSGQENSIQDLLVKAGLSQDEAKNLLDKIENHQKDSIHVLETLTNNPLGAGIGLPLPAEIPVVTDNSADKPQAQNDPSSMLGENAINTNQNPTIQSDKNNQVLDPKIAADILVRLQSDKFNQSVGINLTGDATAKTDQSFFSKIAEEIQAHIKSDKADPLADSKSKNLDSLAFTGNSSFNGGSSTDQAFSIVSTQQNMQDMGSNNKDLSQTLSLQAISDSATKSTETIKVTSFTATLEGSTSPVQDTSLNTSNEVKPVLPQEASSKTTTETSIVNQIIEKFSIRGTGQQNEINIRLDPPDLGTVRVNITSSGDTVKTTLITETHAVKQAIENNLNHLRDSMSEQGLKIDSLTVLVGGGNLGQRGQNTQQQQNGAGSLGAQFSSSVNRPEQITTPLATPRRAIYDDSQSISLFA